MKQENMGLLRLAFPYVMTAILSLFNPFKYQACSVGWLADIMGLCLCAKLHDAVYIMGFCPMRAQIESKSIPACVTFLSQPVGQLSQTSPSSYR